MGLTVPATSEINGTRLIIPSGSSATETVPAPDAACSNSVTLANSPGYDINQFVGFLFLPKKTFTDVSLISSLLASPVTSSPE